MYHWLFTTVHDEIGRNFADNGAEAFEMTEYIAEEIWCDAVFNGMVDEEA